MKLGVISDTHNYFDPKIPRSFAGVEHILHAGDIGLPLILHQLRGIAPVTAVSGNTDEPGLGYPESLTVELCGRKFLLHHIVNPRSPDDTVRDLLLRENPAVVVFGHTHKPFFEKIGAVYFFNPGYAGKSRFGMDRTLAVLNCEAQDLRPEYVRLD